MNDHLLVTLEDGVRRITFNRPERRNAVTLEMFARLAEAIEEAAGDESRVVVIAGAGESFCAGLDLASIAAGDPSQLDVAKSVRELINPPVLKMRAMRKPIVAAVRGPAVGIGFSYVLAADVRLCSESATFSQSFVRVGLMPDGGSTFFLSRLVGRARAFELMATGATLSAADALRLGVVGRVVPDEQFDAAVAETVSLLAAGPQPSLGRIKGALSRDESDALAAALEYEADGQGECFRSADFREGVAAFVQKRRPQFGKG